MEPHPIILLGEVCFQIQEVDAGTGNEMGCNLKQMKTGIWYAVWKYRSIRRTVGNCCASRSEVWKYRNFILKIFCRILRNFHIEQHLFSNLNKKLPSLSLFPAQAHRKKRYPLGLGITCRTRFRSSLAGRDDLSQQLCKHSRNWTVACEGDWVLLWTNICLVARPTSNNEMWFDVLFGRQIVRKMWCPVIRSRRNGTKEN